MNAEYSADREEELIERAAGGDYESFEALVSEFEDRIYNLCLKMLSNEEDAREAVQETFLSAFRNLGSFRGEAGFYTWINRIAVNFCFQKLRARKKEERNVSLEDVHPFPDGKPVGASIPSWDFNPERFTVKAELSEQMRNALAALPEKYRIVFYLKDIDGFTNEKISETLDLSLPAVKSRLNRARLFLRKQLSPYFES